MKLINAGLALGVVVCAAILVSAWWPDEKDARSDLKTSIAEAPRIAIAETSGDSPVIEGKADNGTPLPTQVPTDPIQSQPPRPVVSDLRPDNTLIDMIANYESLPPDADKRAELFSLVSFWGKADPRAAIDYAVKHSRGFDHEKLIVVAYESYPLSELQRRYKDETEEYDQEALVVVILNRLAASKDDSGMLSFLESVKHPQKKQLMKEYYDSLVRQG